MQQMRYFSAEVPRTPLGSLQHSPRSLNWIRGPTSKGREPTSKGREGEKGQGEERPPTVARPVLEKKFPDKALQNVLCRVHV